jgi:hypothetical protein
MLRKRRVGQVAMDIIAVRAPTMVRSEIANVSNAPNPSNCSKADKALRILILTLHRAADAHNLLISACNRLVVRELPSGVSLELPGRIRVDIQFENEQAAVMSIGTAGTVLSVQTYDFWLGTGGIGLRLVPGSLVTKIVPQSDYSFIHSLIWVASNRNFRSEFDEGEEQYQRFPERTVLSRMCESDVRSSAYSPLEITTETPVLPAPMYRVEITIGQSDLCHF